MPSIQPENLEKSKGSIERIFEILNCFTTSNPVVSLEEVQSMLGTAKSTTFRYFKTLCAAGLLTPVGKGAYTIGPRVVELERLVQMTDPLLQAGRQVMGTAVKTVPGTILLLSALYKDKALCIHREGPETIQSQGQAFDIVRSRGVPLPLFQGVASLAILAFLPPPRIRSIYLNCSASIAKVGLGETWPAFRSKLSEYRKVGFAVTVGAYHPHMAGLAVPVLDENAKVIASLTRIFPIDLFQKGSTDQFVADLKDAAGMIGANWLELSSTPALLPERGLVV